MPKPQPTEFPPIEGFFLGVAASPKRVVAVGTHHPGESLLLQERKGSSIKSVPGFPALSGRLQGAAAIGQVHWTVGYEWQFFPSIPGYKLRTVIFHAVPNGPWIRDNSPNVDWTFDATDLADNWLMGVSASAPLDAWAVGKAGDFIGAAGNSPIRCISCHWDGTAWTSVPCADPPGYGAVLFGVAAIGPSKAFAVGGYFVGVSVPGPSALPMIQHWDGQSWQLMPTPKLKADIAALKAIHAVSANELWAVGYACNTTANFRPLIFHYLNGVWSVSPAPSIEGELRGVSGTGPNDVWAVGSRRSGKPLILHWDGTKWSLVQASQIAPLPTPVGLSAVWATSANDVWAAGNRQDPFTSQAWKFVLHWDGSVWSDFPCT